jgi:hypothetical protein
MVLLSMSCRSRETATQAVTTEPLPRSEYGRVMQVPETEAVESRWSVTPRESQAHGLPALGFSLASPPRALIATRFPAAGMLVIFSGPSGGPLGAVAEIDALSTGDPVTLRDALRTTTLVRVGTPREMGESAQVALGDATYGAVAMLAGVGNARTHYCVVVVPGSDGMSRGLLLWFYVPGRGVTVPRCDGVLGHRVFVPFIEGFRRENTLSP